MSTEVPARPGNTGNRAAILELMSDKRPQPDRILIAQAIHESLVIVTGDSQFESYDVRLIRC